MSVFMNFYDPKEVRTIENTRVNYLDELKQMKVWICWNYMEKDGKRTKVPISASGNKTGTDEPHRDTWVTFDEAKAAAAEKNYSGVGFVIPEGYFFLDIDHKPLDDPYVVKMLERFGSYAEKSVSGEGIHIYGKCDFSIIPTERTEKGRVKLSRKYYQKNPNNGTELYIGGLTNRYAVFTENVIQDKPLIDCTEAILTTLEEDMKREAKESVSLRGAISGSPTRPACWGEEEPRHEVKAYQPDTPSEYSERRRRGNPPVITTGCKRKGIPTVAQSLPRNDSAEYVISAMRKQKNSEKFCKLFDEGDFSDYGSQSEADLALCTMIAFGAAKTLGLKRVSDALSSDETTDARSGCSVTLPDAIDNIFRGSALYREKWKRDDYREATINKALENVTFRGVGIPADDVGIPLSKKPAANGRGLPQPASGLRNDITPQNDAPIFIRFKEKTGEPYVVVPLLAQHVRDHLHYLLVRDNGKQGLLKYVYDGGVYKLYADEMFKGCIKQFIEDYDPELVKIRDVNEAFQHIITDRNYISQDDLNAREDIINFRNGLLVVNENELRLVDHNPQIYSTIQIPCRWRDERSATPVFEQYMKTLTNGDNAVARLLLQFMGCCISNVKGWRMKKSLFLVGDGDTGKSQLKSLVERLLGKGNFIGTDLDEIEARFGTGTIYGTRLAGSSDMGFMTVDELKTFKMLTGGDSVFAEFKGIQGFEFTYNGLLWFCMNRLPKFGGDDGKWVYNRIMVVNCPNVIPPERQDKQLLDKMYNECEGIMYLAVRALQKVIRNGYRFDEPESVSQAREAYMAENSTVLSFFEECMIKRPDGKIRDSATTGKVYKVYREWCGDNNRGFAKTAKEFRDNLSNYLGVSHDDLTKRIHGNTYYKDYTLTTACKELYRKAYGYDGARDGENETPFS